LCDNSVEFCEVVFGFEVADQLLCDIASLLCDPIVGMNRFLARLCGKESVHRSLRSALCGSDSFLCVTPSQDDFAAAAHR
jgi:hypothetical protein